MGDTVGWATFVDGTEVGGACGVAGVSGAGVGVEAGATGSGCTKTLARTVGAFPCAQLIPAGSATRTRTVRSDRKPFTGTGTVRPGSLARREAGPVTVTNDGLNVYPVNA